MHRRLLTISASFAISALLAGCSLVRNDTREDYGFQGQAGNVPFELTVKTGPMEQAEDSRRLKDAAGNQSMRLDESTPPCADEANHDDVYQVTIKADPKKSTEDLDLTVFMDVSDAMGNDLTSKTTTGGDIRIAWLTEERATCQRTSDDSFAKMQLSKGEDYQVKGLVVLPGGKDNYDGFELSISTDAGKVHSLKGGAKLYQEGVGVTVDLLP